MTFALFISPYGLLVAFYLFQCYVYATATATAAAAVITTALWAHQINIWSTEHSNN